MKELCLFCNQHERGHPVTVNYLCGKCVQLFLGTTKEIFEKLKLKAEKKNNPRILKAIRMFYR